MKKRSVQRRLIKNLTRLKILCEGTGTIYKNSERKFV